MKSNKIADVINKLENNWSLCFVGADHALSLASLLSDLKCDFSQTGDGKRISSGFSYWGIGPTLAWERACEDRFYRVMYQSTKYFGELLKEIFDSLGSQNYHYVSLGIGTGTKDNLILQKLYDRNKNLCYFPVDMSQEMLRIGVQAAVGQTPVKRDRIFPLQIDFSSKENVDQLKELLHSVVGDERPILFSLLGNTLSNFEDDNGLLKVLSRMIRPQDKLLLEVAVTDSLSEEAQSEAANEYHESRLFKLFVSSSLNQNTNLPVDPNNVVFVGSAEEERAILIKALYPSTGKPSKIMLPDRSETEFRKNDTIRLYTMRKYTPGGVNEILKNCRLSPVRRVTRHFAANRQGFNFGMEMLLLSPAPAGEELFEWDVFLCHASPDKEIAKKLSSILEKNCNVFIDCEDIAPGESWYIKLVQAQRKSLMSVILVSKNTKDAHYQKEEILTAIEQIRASEKTHRLLPIIYGDLTNEEIPYGLKGVQGIKLQSDAGVESVAAQIIEQLRKIKTAQ